MLLSVTCVSHGGVLALFMVAVLTLNALRAARRPIGESAGPAVAWLHSRFFYAFTLGFDIVVGILLWIPLPGKPFSVVVTILGALSCFSGMAFALG